MAVSDNRAGDKVSVRFGNRSVRGTFVKALKNTVKVETDEGEVVQVEITDIRNYSAAARSAWMRMPERKVGRPKGSTSTKRISVTLRLDQELWEKFRLLEREKKIMDRTKLFNELLARVTREVDQREQTKLHDSGKGRKL